uniref:Uncharacterized protein n=1 Tax=Oryza sativa subsp. japonica TaxID=39947 RepID=Q6K659_ORYSJ|nr:unknown protein [Oryza sativa Japonica Group]
MGGARRHAGWTGGGRAGTRNERWGRGRAMGSGARGRAVGGGALWQMSSRCAGAAAERGEGAR